MEFQCPGSKPDSRLEGSDQLIRSADAWRPPSTHPHTHPLNLCDLQFTKFETLTFLKYGSKAEFGSRLHHFTGFKMKYPPTSPLNQHDICLSTPQNPRVLSQMLLEEIHFAADVIYVICLPKSRGEEIGTMMGRWFGMISLTSKEVGGRKIRHFHAILIMCFWRSK